MNKIAVGMIAKSTAGHDRDHLYVIVDVSSAYVYLADGKIRTLGHPKKKNQRHVQIVGSVNEQAGADDIEIKRILKAFNGPDKEN